MLILSNDKAQTENKAETPFGKYTAKCLPDLPQASALVPCDLVGLSIDPACSKIFHLSISCCGNSMKSRSDGCQDQMGFSKNSTYSDSWW